MKYFLIHYIPGNAWVEGQSVYKQDLFAHGHYMQQLFEKGILVMGGPFMDDTGGTSVIKVSSQEEAEEILLNDPAVNCGVFKASMHPWHVVFHAINDHEKHLGQQ